MKNTEPSQFQYKKKLQELVKMEKKLQKIYPKYYNLLIAQDLWHAHYQILPIIFRKEFIELNVNLDTMIKNMKQVALPKYYDCFVEYTNFKDNLIECKCLCCNRNYQNKLDENLKKRLFNTYNFSNHHSNKFFIVAKRCLSL